MPLGDMIRRSAHRFPNRTALVFRESQQTYFEFNRRVNRLAHALLGLGLRKGDRVALLSHNEPAFFEVYFACAKSGVIFIPINNLLRKAELLQILNYVEPRCLFFDPEFKEVIGALRSELRSIEVSVCLRGEGTGPPRPPMRVLIVTVAALKSRRSRITDDDVMSIFLTSGTTGLPKGAMRTHRHIYLNALTSTAEIGS